MMVATTGRLNELLWEQMMGPTDRPIDNIHDWPSFFAEVRQRPAMWLGAKSALALECVVQGIGLAEYFYHVSSDDALGGFDWNAFEKWVDAHQNPRRLSCRSFSLARMASTSPEEAFNLWMTWYDDYRAQVEPAGNTSETI